MRYTYAGLLSSILGAITFLFGRIYQINFLTSLGLLILIFTIFMPVYSFISYRYWKNRAPVLYFVPESRYVMEGSDISATLYIRNSTTRLLPRLSLTNVTSLNSDKDPAILSKECPLFYLESGHVVSPGLVFTQARRGVNVLPAPKLWQLDPLGITGYMVASTAPATVYVYPKIYPVNHNLALRDHRPVNRGRQRIDREIQNDTTDTIREFAEGDRPSMIHWPATLRSNRYIVKAFNYHAQKSAVIFIDNRRELLSDKAFENLLSASLSLITDLLRRGVVTSVILADFTSLVIDPNDRISKNKVLELFCKLSLVESPNFYEHLTGHFNNSHFNILITSQHSYVPLAADKSNEFDLVMLIGNQDEWRSDYSKYVLPVCSRQTMLISDPKYLSVPISSQILT
jgi:uncharacterized protein (DUF58 family)